MTAPHYILKVARQCADVLPEEYREVAFKNLVNLWEDRWGCEIAYVLDAEKFPGRRMLVRWEYRTVEPPKREPQAYWLCGVKIILHDANAAIVIPNE